ncbi:MAG: hypothetical protein F6K50_25185 [Moorea sp. SIO3I7]|uniref:hypothetical protein n=1 Tax=unclassified Moorena TaxID=2683338 RepID=UPI0013C63B9C|nr:MULTISPECIES: hypothetical protein [unclassified Moorena]NEN98679.1 hypothetical protein [Moorena sp. SIO3I7]NEQ59471.1 hypothetical protein [Moorena sp. SIO4A1]
MVIEYRYRWTISTSDGTRRENPKQLWYADSNNQLSVKHIYQFFYGSREYYL